MGRHMKHFAIAVTALLLSLGACGGSDSPVPDAGVDESPIPDADVDSTVVMPNVVGLDEPSARAALSAVGLTMKVYKTFNSTVPAGRVISSTPDPGGNAIRDVMAAVFLSKGADPSSLTTTPSSTTPPPPPPTPAPTAAPATWYPAGFRPYGGGIAYRFLPGGSFRCDLSGVKCFGIEVASRYGCDSLYVTVNVVDSSGRIIDDAIDSLQSLPAGRIGVLKPFYVSSTSSSNSGQLAEITCF